MARAALAACLCQSLSGCYPLKHETAGTRQRLVEVLRLRPAPLARTITLVGTIEPAEEVVLFFEVPGKVAEVLVEEGQHVEKDMPIARLVADDFQMSVKRAEAELAAVRARLDLLRAGTRKEDLAAAEAASQAAAARATYWTGEWNRTSKLFQNGTISATEMEQIRREYDAAVQDDRARQAMLHRARAGPRPQEILEAEAQEASLKQSLALAQRQLDKATLLAPFGGFIEVRYVDPGAFINVFPNGGVPVAHLVNLEYVDAVIAVPEIMRNRLQDQTRIEITSSVDPQIRAQADVVALSHVADSASGTYALRARLPNPNGEFTGEMVIKADFTEVAEHSSIQVPLDAVRRPFGQSTYVLLVKPKDQRVVSQEVKLGAVVGQQVEVLQGLSEGNLLIVNGHDRILEGDRVQTTFAASEPIATRTDRVRDPVRETAGVLDGQDPPRPLSRGTVDGDGSARGQRQP